MGGKTKKMKTNHYHDKHQDSVYFWGKRGDCHQKASGGPAMFFFLTLVVVTQIFTLELFFYTYVFTLYVFYAIFQMDDILPNKKEFNKTPITCAQNSTTGQTVPISRLTPLAYGNT